MYTCIYIHYKYTCIHTSAHGGVCICIYIDTYLQHMYIHIYIYMYVFVPGRPGLLQ